MFQKVNYLIDYFKYLENPISCLKFKFGFSNSCNVKVKNTTHSVELKNVSSLNKLMSTMFFISKDKCDEFVDYIKEIDCDNKIVNIGGINYINIYNSNFIKNSQLDYLICTEEYFYGDEWNMVNFSGRNVIDLGGNNGDTALIFAKKGAKVIGFEPVKHLYELAIENIDLNKDLKDNIEFVNKAGGGKRGKLDIINSVDVYVGKESSSYKVDVITISDILNDYDIKPDILKMDCEGCEFGIIENEDLSMFNDIIFEHHAGIVGKEYNDLIEILKNQNFNIKLCPISTHDFEDIGIIHAYK